MQFYNFVQLYRFDYKNANVNVILCILHILEENFLEGTFFRR